MNKYISDHINPPDADTSLIDWFNWTKIDAELFWELILFRSLFKGPRENIMETYE